MVVLLLCCVLVLNGGFLALNLFFMVESGG